MRLQQRLLCFVPELEPCSQPCGSFCSLLSQQLVSLLTPICLVMPCLSPPASPEPPPPLGILSLQVKFLFGYSQYTIPSKTGNPKDAKKVTFPRHDPIQEQLHDLLGPEWTPYFHWREFIMGGAFIVILLSMKYVGKRFPRYVWCTSAASKSCMHLPHSHSILLKLLHVLCISAAAVPSHSASVILH